MKPAGIEKRIDALNAAAKQLPAASLRDVPALATPMTDRFQHGPAAPVWRDVTHPDHTVPWTHTRHP